MIDENEQLRWRRRQGKRRSPLDFGPWITITITTPFGSNIHTKPMGKGERKQQLHIYMAANVQHEHFLFITK